MEFILFFNKYDVLVSKLRSGIRFSNYVTNYDDEYETKNRAEDVARREWISLLRRRYG